MRIFVHIPSQTLDLLDARGRLLRRFACSTSAWGIGTEPGSNKTPTGRFRIAEKHGDGAPPGMIFKSRKATGEIGRDGDSADHVQTRILWLEARHPGKPRLRPPLEPRRDRALRRSTRGNRSGDFRRSASAQKNAGNPEAKVIARRCSTPPVATGTRLHHATLHSPRLRRRAIRLLR
jgi:L,D-transpeptidase catalytic domain